MERRGKHLRRGVAGLLLGVQVTLLAGGCVSVKTTATRPSDGPGGGVAVAVYASDAARRAGVVGPPGLLGELERREGRRWRPVFRSLNPSWAVVGLPAGTYRVRFPARLTEAGDVERLGRPVERSLKVQDGVITEVRVTLSHVPAALVAAGVLTVVVAAVVLAKFLDDHDLPTPPLPPPELMELAFYVSLDLAQLAAWQEVRDRQPPLVTSHFPAARAVVAARRPRVIFALSEPLAPRSLRADAVLVLGENSGLMDGVVAYDADRWWVTWTPAVDLPPGDTFRVTLTAQGVRDASGNELAAPVSFSFTTPR